MLYFTTSWDDGHVLDLRLAEMLSKYGIQGTFFLSKHYFDQSLTNENIRELNKSFEIGAHTLTHPRLPTLSLERQIEEIDGSKKWLEDLLGQECHGFCYPGGRYNADSLLAVKKLQFRYARTVAAHSFDLEHDVYQMPTSAQVYPYPIRRTGRVMPHLRDPFCPINNNRPLTKLIGSSVLWQRNWNGLMDSVFDWSMHTQQSVFHLWGHSWEIDKYGMWKPLERFLEFVSKVQSDKITFVDNLNISMKLESPEMPRDASANTHHY
jgi:peptidoglycan/xylan/chitin deacetylase (PgdA/CDA1 family)